MSVRRVIGQETEFGILDSDDTRANPIVLSSELVEAYGRVTQTWVPWDFHGEDPLNDARGHRLERAAAHPSQLTDTPQQAAPSFEDAGLLQEEQRVQLRRPRAANLVLTNGARLYVDHAHPEYSSPETATPREAVLWDRAGEIVVQRAIEQLRAEGRHLAVYKNNVDGKGAAYGAHENYLMSRETSFTDIIRYLTPFFVTRPLVCGTGRVGRGQRSELPGFQISQRADYVENDIGLETTFNRPIINTRDEPHALYEQYRRLHVIGGDANLFDVSNLLKVGTTSLVLWLIENDEIPLELDSISLESPVYASWQVSHGYELDASLALRDGSSKTAVAIQEIYYEAVQSALERHGVNDPDTREVMEYWEKVLCLLRCKNWDAAAPYVEWVAKYRLMEAMRYREGLAWDADKLKALDLQWHDLTPERSIVARLDAAGQVARLFSPDEVNEAVTTAPDSTRAYLRGGLIRAFGSGVAAAGWDGVVLNVSGELMRIPLMHPERATNAHVGDILRASNDPADFLRRLSGFRH